MTTGVADVSVASLQGEAVTHARAQELLRDALGDPTLILALASPDDSGFVDSAGEPLTLPADGTERATIMLSAGDRPIAAVLRDPLLGLQLPVLEWLTATVLVLIENTRLLEEVRLSRRRLLASAERDRIRLERDLHDGATQRLLAAQIRLGLLREKVASGEIAEELAAISAQALAALDEIRAVRDGIYPSVLQDFGLPTALRSATVFLPLEVDVIVDGVERLDPSIEGTIYFCVIEALQNAAAHAGPNARATVTLKRERRSVDFEVTDDGTGFSPEATANGLGLFSILDRVEALGGRVTISSTLAGGTSVNATIPT